MLATSLQKSSLLKNIFTHPKNEPPRAYARGIIH